MFLLFFFFSVLTVWLISRQKKSVFTLFLRLMIVFLLSFSMYLSINNIAPEEKIIIFDISYSSVWLQQQKKINLQELYQQKIDLLYSQISTKEKWAILYAGDQVIKARDLILVDAPIILPPFPLNEQNAFLERAFSVASQMFASSSFNKKVIVYTDGLLSDTEVKNITKYYGQFSIEWNYLAQSTIENIKDVSIISFDVPRFVKRGASIIGTLQVSSSRSTKAIISLFENENTLLHQKKVFIPNKGIFRFHFAWQTNQKVTHKVYAQITATDFSDDCPINNSYSNEIIISGTTKILEFGEQLHQMNLSQFDITSISQKSMEEQGKLQQIPFSEYDILVISNIEAKSMEYLFPDIQSQVAQGRGFMMLPSMKTFGLGGYNGTIIEEILPVLCLPENQEKLYIFVLLDKSGSMNGKYNNSNKIQEAKEALFYLVKQLKSNTVFTFSVFSEKVEEVIKLSVIEKNREDIYRKILGVEASGQTKIAQAIAHMLLEVQNLKLTKNDKAHVILISDGVVNQDTFLQKLAQIPPSCTVSVIATNNDSKSIQILQDIATWGKGNFYLAESTSIKEVVAQDLHKLKNDILITEKSTLIANENVFPHWDWKSYSGITVNQYIGTTKKNNAYNLLHTHNKKPILTIGNYFLGKTAALTTNIYDPWTEKFTKKGHQLIATTLSWLSTTTKRDFEIEVTTASQQIHINIQIFSENKHNREFVLESKEFSNIKFEEKKSGYYQVIIPKQQNKSIIKIEEQKYGKMIDYLLISLNVPYPSELANLCTVHLFPSTNLELAHKTIKDKQTLNIVLISLAIFFFLVERIVRK